MKNTTKQTLVILIGTRPNFIKITQFRKIASDYTCFDLKIIHSNQHFDDNMSDVFFRQFNLEIDYYLPKYDGHPAGQIGHIIKELNDILADINPALMMVVGDVNTTMAGAIVANKRSIRLAHIESGLRSFDRTMPEEINRIVTDELTDYFFVTEPSGIENLRNEGKPEDHIFFVGNTMIDTLIAYKNEIHNSEILSTLGLTENNYILVTLHRPSNVDKPENLQRCVALITKLAELNQVVLPLHPRTKNNLRSNDLLHRLTDNPSITVTDSLDYLSFQKLISGSCVVITDSGGIQEETTFLQIPCITLRQNTERPVTTQSGSNTLMDFDIQLIYEMVTHKKYRKGQIPELWDGEATKRIFQVIYQKRDVVCIS